MTKMEFKVLKKEICWFRKTYQNRRKIQERSESEEKVLALNARENKCKTRIENSSRANVTSVASMATELQTVGEIATKMTIEKTIRLQESPASTGNATTAEKESTRLLIVGQRKKNRKTMTLTNS